jgi:hypothetical protein
VTTRAGPPSRCPSCAGALTIERLRCGHCATEVQGSFPMCAVCSLDDDARAVLDLFLDARGNLKDVQRAMGVSYPTARARVDAMFHKLDAGRERRTPMDVLKRLRAGEITVDEAERLLRTGANR